MVRGSFGELGVEPDGDAFKVVVAGREDAGGDQGVAKVAFGVPVGQFVQQVVADRTGFGGEVGQESGG
ncbi:MULTISPECIES: hypothetical protein [unclassified Kitasatospora]|uniref:hypothetical protein n=1 Tax=unclassified Kitasatospora TaxID=2633591 RepID=UPI00340659F1